jgi:mRNA interferase RelE/StbE
MNLEFESSFNRDLKKIPSEVLIELDEVLEAIENATSLNSIPYSIKKMSGFPKLKAFRLKFNRNKSFRIGFYLDGDCLFLSRILDRKEIYKLFP